MNTKTYVSYVKQYDYTTEPSEVISDRWSEDVQIEQDCMLCERTFRASKIIEICQACAF